MDERAAWTEQNMDAVRESARFPFKGGRNAWWSKAEDPWQCLACCFEINDALNSPNPEQFASRLPVHQDGSCNGLQHYAALGRDDWGGKAVNLFPAERPQDVYSGVLAHVIAKVAKDAETNANPWAKFVNGKLTRKVVKQTVMTSVYGVTQIGARDQVLRQLKDRDDITFTQPEGADPVLDPKSGVELRPEQIQSRTAGYIAQTTLNSLGALFTSAKDIMDWLREIASIIAGEDAVVCWTTPLGLPIVQPYLESNLYPVHTGLQSIYLEREDTPEIAAFGARAAAAAAAKAAKTAKTAKTAKISAGDAQSTTTTLIRPHEVDSDLSELAGPVSAEGDPSVGDAQSAEPFLHADAEAAAKAGADVDPSTATGPSPNARSQRAALPPNYVHSLDATHMMMTALDCERRGVTFASVHDSYWTHAGSMDEMNIALREQFIKLYSVDLLAKLHAELQERYQLRLPPPPKRGTLDLERVRDSLYFFS